MEYFEGNLYNLMNMFINEGKRISGLSIFCIISEIRLILDYLESINLINVDIKLENFVYEYNSDLDIYKVVMIDYSSLLPINCVSYKFSTYPRFKDEFAYEKIADKKDHYYGLFVIGLRLLYSNCLDLRTKITDMVQKTLNKNENHLNRNELKTEFIAKPSV
jgi:serine/threonine protein kinase